MEVDIGTDIYSFLSLGRIVGRYGRHLKFPIALSAQYDYSIWSSPFLPQPMVEQIYIAVDFGGSEIKRIILINQRL